MDPIPGTAGRMVGDGEHSSGPKQAAVRSDWAGTWSFDRARPEENSGPPFAGLIPEV